MGLKLRDVTFSYDGVDKVLEGISLDLEKERIMSLLGRSGSGKTTILNIIAGFLKPLRGRVLIDGVDVTDLHPGKRNVGMVFQDLALFPHMSARENIEFPLRAKGIVGKDMRRRSDDIMELVGIFELGVRNVTKLSGGERQRVALARSLVYRPSLLLMDEPLSSMDPGMKDDLRRDIVRILKDTGTTTLYVTHDRVEVLTISDRICIIDKGRIAESGDPASVFWRPGSIAGAGFMGVCGPIPVGSRGGGWADSPFGRIPDPGPGATHIGFRPESIEFEKIDDSLRIPGIVRGAEYLGHQYLLEISTDGGTIRSPSAVPFDPGVELTLYIPFKDLIPLR